RRLARDLSRWTVGFAAAPFSGALSKVSSDKTELDGTTEVVLAGGNGDCVPPSPLPLFGWFPA
ncbi:MAG: hypothetical protein WCA35_11040, partial [Kovacikia sp.]